MTTREYLSQIERLEKMIQNKLSEIGQLGTMACGVTVSVNKEYIQKSTDKDKMGSIVSRIVDLEKEVDEMVNKRSFIVNQINGLTDINSYDILAKRYILKKDLKIIAVEKGVSFRYIGKMHTNALRIFEKKYGKLYLT